MTLKDTSTVPTDDAATCGPHSFQPVRWWDNRNIGRCRHCYLPRFMHPVKYWTEARPLGDFRGSIVDLPCVFCERMTCEGDCVKVKTTAEPAPEIVMDARGIYWRRKYYGSAPFLSMVPVSDDNDPIAYPLIVYRIVDQEDEER